MEKEKKKEMALSLLKLMDRCFPAVSISSFIWYFLDQDVTMICSKVHLIIAGLCVLPFTYFRFFN
jgi:hypothetical protein